MEHAALAEAAAHQQVTFHGADQALGNGQAKPRSAIFARRRAVGLGKLGEQAPELFRRHADAGIFDVAATVTSRIVILNSNDAQTHMAVLGEFDGIAQQVDQDLAEAQLIADQIAQRRHRPIVEQQLQAPVFRLSWTMNRAFWMTPSRSKRTASRTTLPASIFEKSRMSFRMPSRERAAAWIFDIVVLARRQAGFEGDRPCR